MKTLTWVLVILISAAGFTSCQKEADGTNPQNPSADTVQLKSVIYLDTTKAAGQDTVYKSLYFYDNAGRITKSYTAEYTYTPAVQILAFTYDFFYNGSNPLPFKQVITQDNIAPYHSFLTYNNAGEVIRDSSFWALTPSAVSLQSFTAAAGGSYVYVFKEKNLTTGAITDRDSVVYRRTIVNGNITSGIDSSFHPTLGISTVSYAYSYDNKTSPFAALNIGHTLGYYSFSGDGVLPAGKNNATSFNETYFDGVNTSQYSGTVTYIYGTDGLPATGRISGFPDANKIIYSYY